MGRTTVVILALALALTASAAPQEAQHFEGDGLVVQLAPSGDDGVKGEVAKAGAQYPLTGRATRDGERVRITGTFTADGTAFAFSAVREGDALAFQTGQKTYRLKAVAAAAAAAGRDVLTLSRVEIRDIHMGDRVSHTMYVPQGWTFQGRTEWSEGMIVYPQLNIEVRSSEGFSVRFNPAAHLAYSEMDPNFTLQLKQSGLWDPQIHKERVGLPPPADIGEFLVGYITRNNTAVSDVRLVDQKRDRAAEDAIRKALPGVLDESTAMHVVNIQYKRDGVLIREEINLTYSQAPPQRGASTVWFYSIMTGAIVSGPAEGFAKAKPLLYCVANSLRTTANWHHCSQKVLAEIQAARHQANMENIRQWGEAIRKAGEEYSKMSDARMKNWKEQQKVDDELQRDRINRIYDLYTVTDAEGNRIAVPLGYPHVYKTNDGKFVASPHKITDNPALTPLEVK